MVEDDAKVQALVRRRLESEGARVEVAADCAAAIEKSFQFQPDLVVLDIDLPDTSGGLGERMDGLRVLEQLRRKMSVPVVMLTRTTSISVKVLALNIGADDFVTKPFDSEELVARIRAVLRRGSGVAAEGSILAFRQLKIDPKTCRVWKSEREIKLTALELSLLLVLAKRPGWVFSREQLIRGAWEFDRYGDERVVDTHIGHLRKKIEDNPSRPTLIVTVHGVGYRFEDQVVQPPRETEKGGERIVFIAALGIDENASASRRPPA